MRAITFHSMLQQELNNKKLTISRLSQLTRINRGTLSSILNGNPLQMPSIAQLDKITFALDHKEGYFYDLYITCYFEQFNPHWKRLKPLLYHCVRMKAVDKIERILELLMEDASQTGSVFAVAEEWYDEGYTTELIPFYECIIRTEKLRHAEHMTISQYRIFHLSQSDEDFELNVRAAIRFEPYLSELAIHHRLDALLKLTNIYFAVHDWNKSMSYAEDMRILSHYAYERRLHMDNPNTKEEDFSLNRHLVTYYGHSYLMIGACFEEQKQYKEALNFVPKYENLGWFEGLDAEGRKEVRKLSVFAKANFLGLQVLLGNEQYLVEYVAFLEKFPDEILPGLITIVQVANKYEFEIDYIINKFSFILAYTGEAALIINDYYSILNTLERYERLYRQMAIYYFRKGEYMDGIQYISQCLAVANRINKKSDFVEYPELLHLLKEWSVLLSQQKNM